MNHTRNTAFSHHARLFLAGGILICLAACETKTSDRDLRPVGPQEAVNLAVPRSDGAFGSMTNPIWIDPRIKEAYDTAHIAGAVNMPFGSGMFEDMARENLDGRKPILVYGDGFQDILADAASKRLIQIGYKNVYTLRGGLQQWEADGYEVVRADGDTDGDTNGK